MSTSAIIAICAAFTMCFCTIFPSLSQGKTATKAMEAIARQPEAAGDIRSSLILSLGLMEAITIYGLLIAFMLVARI